MVERSHTGNNVQTIKVNYGYFHTIVERLIIYICFMAFKYIFKTSKYKYETNKVKLC